MANNSKVRKDIKRGMFLQCGKVIYRIFSYNNTYVKLNWDNIDEKKFHLLPDFHAMIDNGTYLLVTDKNIEKALALEYFQKELKEFANTMRDNLHRMFGNFIGEYGTLEFMNGLKVDTELCSIAEQTAREKDLLFGIDPMSKKSYTYKMRKHLGYTYP